MTRAPIAADQARRLTRIALGHVTREYPNKPGHILEGPADARTPAQLHPIFHGSFDWHSCVHSYWLLAHLRRHDAPAIDRLFDHAFTPHKVEAERAYLADFAHAGFERPYGWAWLLKLAAELQGTRWSAILAPLAELVADRFRAFLPIAPYPVRSGGHFNTAFALRLAADYAEATGDAGFLALLRTTAETWYGDDRDCPAWGEPGGDDFLSPTLIEAECLRRLLPPDRFRIWLDAFLPRLAGRHPATLFTPAAPTDRSDGKIAHLDGLNLGRAWCFRTLSAALVPADPRHPVLQAAADAHLAATLPHLETHYMGEHWLATFALLALET